jgi:hypothetical protein
MQSKRNSLGRATIRDGRHLRGNIRIGKNSFGHWDRYTPMQLNINLDKLAALNIDNACGLREDLSGNRMATTSNIGNPTDSNYGQ